MNIAEYKKWLDRTTEDGECSLHLSKEQIVLCLLEKAKELLVEHLVEKGGKSDFLLP